MRSRRRELTFPRIGCLAGPVPRTPQYYLGNLGSPMANPARHWCFTLNNPTLYPDELCSSFHDANVDYAVFQLEEGESGTPHYQGYLILSGKQRLGTLRLLIPGAHFEVAKGTPKQNRDYCTKEPRIGNFCEYGIFPETGVGQGARSDMDSLHAALQAGLDTSAYSNGYFSFFLRYPNLVENYSLAQLRGRTGLEATRCTLYYGPPGTGKSRLASSHGLFFQRGLFRKPPGRWWDGYRGEGTVLLDDFRGSSCSFTDFKLCVDRYPLRVEVKGSSCPLGATRFLITSNYLPTDWWAQEVVGSHVEAITRRIDDVYWMPLPGIYRYFPTFQEFSQTVATAMPEHVPGPVLSEVSYDHDGTLLSPLPQV